MLTKTVGYLAEDQEALLVRCTINERPYVLVAAPDTTLFQTLRDLGFSSVKCGCETSNCGVCTVWLDGRPVLSCSVLAGQLEGREVTTIEALHDEAAHFAEFLAREGGDQCGFCVPGMVMNALWLARRCVCRGYAPTDLEIRQALFGNLCRCSGYAVHSRAIRNYINDLLQA